MRIEKAMIDFYEAMSGEKVDTFDQLPERVRLFFINFQYADLCQPLVAKMLREGFTERQIGLRYQLSRSTVRNIKYKFRIRAKKQPAGMTGN